MFLSRGLFFLIFRFLFTLGGFHDGGGEGISQANSDLCAVVHRLFVLHSGFGSRVGGLFYVRHSSTSCKLAGVETPFCFEYSWEKRVRHGQTHYGVVGYATVYPFYAFPDRKRLRIRSHSFLQNQFANKHSHTSSQSSVDFTALSTEGPRK